MKLNIQLRMTQLMNFSRPKVKQYFETSGKSAKNNLTFAKE